MRLIFFFVPLLFLSSAWSQLYCVTKSGAKLYSQASSSSQMTWQVPKFMPLVGTGARKNNFVEVKDVDGQKHWIASKEVTAQKRCLVVSSKRTRLRIGPGNKYSLSNLGVADRYYSFLDLGGEDGWTKIQDEYGGEAWVNLDHVWKPSHKLRMSFDQ